MKTFLPKPDDKARNWFVVDAADKPLGKLAVRVANLLRGRGKVTFTPQVDLGDFVVVINAAKVHLSGKKEQKKVYERYSGFRGGQSFTTAEQLRERHPELIVWNAVKGMLPRNTMSRTLIKRLKVCPGAEHPHAAQNPKLLEAI